MKSLKALTILLILISISGCANRLVQPLCLPDRPVNVDLSIEQQAAIEADTLEIIGNNDDRLKTWIVTVERITDAHNDQFKAECL